MGDDFVTEKELELREKNLSLTISAELRTVLDEKFGDLQTSLDESNITRRNQAIHEATGFEWGEKEKIKKGVQFAYAEAVNQEDTNSKLKTALINYGVPVSIASIAGYLAGHWPWGP